MQKYAKICEICKNMWKYVRACILNGYLGSLPSLQDWWEEKVT